MVNPHTAMEQWGLEQAKAVGLSPKEITYDSEMLMFVFDGQPEWQKIKLLKQSCIDSKFIKPPYQITYLEETTDDYDLEPGEVMWTMGFWNCKNETKV